LFAGQPMGQGIDVPGVTAAHDERLEGLGPAPVVLTTIADDAPVRRTGTGMQLGGLRDAVARDVARQAVEILNASATIVEGGTSRPVVPADVAVLVRTRQQAGLVQGHLVAAGVPSVVNGVGNVLASPAARDWMHVLRALDRPSQGGLARLAALTDLVGWSTGRVAGATDADRDALHIILHDWRQVLQTSGIAAAFRQMAAHTDLAARLLARPDGDRKLTDLEHVAELLHAHSSSHVVGTAGLLAWLESGAAEAAASSRLVPPDNLASRLERGGDAVQIMTVHGAKGLEFGIVLAPYLWDVVGRTPVVRSFHDHRVGRRRIFVGSRARGADQEHMEAVAAQERDHEERRLAYVAATRARHHLRLWWAPADRAAQSPLGTLLARPALVHSTVQARQAVAALQQASPGLFAVADADLTAPLPSLTPQPIVGGAPVLAPFGRRIDHGWRRTSYSRLVGDAHAAADEAGGQGETRDVQASAGVTATADDGPPTGGPDGDAVEVPAVLPAPDLDVPVPLGPMRGGADVGSTLHAVLEHVDFTLADLPRALRTHLDREVTRHAIDLGEDADLDVIATGLASALATPLFPGGPALVHVGRDARLDEMAFELPVLTAELAVQPGRVLVTDIADLLEAHLPADDPLVGYGVALRRGMVDVEVRGFLAGFVDLLIRLPGREDYVVADYKTNRMAPAGVEEVTVGHFTATTMAAEMITHHYPLQAIVYLVAAHRFLRWRIRGYDPDRHLAGVAYLFLRGMTGPDTPVRDGMVCGVFRWRPPTPLLLALDRLLATGIDPSDRPTGGARA
ncbi:MAG TPA: 3'-5' exonuclease, partial [Euzebya sp.]|nr:3'-5' exonuclease [Euzebya sp.]